MPRWDTIERLLAESTDPRERAVAALMAHGGLRRSEVVALDMGDYAPEFGLRRVQGEGGLEAALPLPEVARAILGDYLAKERAGVASTEAIFVVRYRTRGGAAQERRMSGQRVSKLIKALGRRAGLPSSTRMRSVTGVAWSCIGGPGAIYASFRSICVTPIFRRPPSTLE